MIIKKYTGKTENDAVSAAKKELGESVVVMNVKNVKKKGFFGFLSARQVEITVGLEEENPAKYQRESVRQTAPAPETAAPRMLQSLNAQKISAENIEKKLDSLQVFLENQMKKQEEAQAARQEEKSAESAAAPVKSVAESEEAEENTEEKKFLRLIYNTMMENEVDEKYANQLLEELSKGKKNNVTIEFLLANIYQKMILKFGRSEKISSEGDSPNVIFMVGPTGVGKTTTIAKLASYYSVEEKKKVALLTCDTYRIAAAEQMRVYANILEVPFRVIYTAEEMKQAVQDFSDYDYIFVDTSGHSHKKDELLEKTKEFFDILKDAVKYQVFLVLSATTKYQDLLRIAEKYSSVTEYQLIFTKLDETQALGNLYNLRMHTQAPVAYVTDGQNVPDDIECFNPQKVVKQLLGGKS